MAAPSSAATKHEIMGTSPDSLLPSPSSSPLPWGTWEDLLLASAVKKHGTSSWSLVAAELQARAMFFNLPPPLLSPEACRARFHALNGRYSSCSSGNRDEDLGNNIPWFEELRKLRVAQLKRELEHYDGSIGYLQKKLKRLKAERAQNISAKKAFGKSPAVDEAASHCNSLNDKLQTLHTPNLSERINSPAYHTREYVEKSFPSLVADQASLQDAADGAAVQVTSTDGGAATILEASDGSAQGDQKEAGAVQGSIENDIAGIAAEVVEDRSDVQGGDALKGSERRSALPDDACVLGGPEVENQQALVCPRGVEDTDLQGLQGLQKEEGLHQSSDEGVEATQMGTSTGVSLASGDENQVREPEPEPEPELMEEKGGAVVSDADAEDIRADLKNVDPPEPLDSSCCEAAVPALMSDVNNGTGLRNQLEAGQGEGSLDDTLLHQKFASEAHPSEEGSLKKATKCAENDVQDSAYSGGNQCSEVGVQDEVLTGVEACADANESVYMGTQKSDTSQPPFPSRKGTEMLTEEDDGCYAPQGLEQNGIQDEGPESMVPSSVASAIDLLRLAYGSAQDMTPVSTPDGPEAVIVASESGTTAQPTASPPTSQTSTPVTATLMESFGMPAEAGQLSEPMGSENTAADHLDANSLTETIDCDQTITMEIDHDCRIDLSECNQLAEDKRDVENAFSEEKTQEAPTSLQYSGPSLEAENADENLYERAVGVEAQVQPRICESKGTGSLQSEHLWMPTEDLPVLGTASSAPLTQISRPQTPCVTDEDQDKSEKLSGQSGECKILGAPSSTPLAQIARPQMPYLTSEDQDKSEKIPGQNGECQDHIVVSKDELQDSHSMKEMEQDEAGDTCCEVQSYDLTLKNCCTEIDDKQAPMEIAKDDSISKEMDKLPWHDKGKAQEVATNHELSSEPHKWQEESDAKDSECTSNHAKSGLATNDTEKLHRKQEKLEQAMKGILAEMEEVNESDPHNHTGGSAGHASKGTGLHRRGRRKLSRGGRAKGIVQRQEEAASERLRRESGAMESSVRFRRRNNTPPVPTTRRTRLNKLTQKTSDRNDEDDITMINVTPAVIGENKPLSTSLEDSGILQEVFKTSEGDPEEGLQEARDYNDSQLERSEVGSLGDGTEDTSPMSKRNRREPKVPGKLLPLLECLRLIGAHKFAPLFKQRQESQINARYNLLIRRHMDLSMVRARLEEGVYSGSLEFFRDLLLIFNNALVFHSRDSHEYGAALVLRECVMKEMEKIFQTEALLKNAGPATRKREPKKASEAAKTGSSVTVVEGARGPSKSSLIENAVSEASPDQEANTRGGNLGLGFPTMNKDIGLNSSSRRREQEFDGIEKGVRETIKGITRSKPKVEVQATEHDKSTKSFAVQKPNDVKEENSKSLGEMDVKAAMKNELHSNLESDKGPPIPSKAKEKSVRKDLDNNVSKGPLARQDTAPQGVSRKGGGLRPLRNLQAVQQARKGSQGPSHSQKRARS